MEAERWGDMKENTESACPFWEIEAVGDTLGVFLSPLMLSALPRALSLRGVDPNPGVEGGEDEADLVGVRLPRLLTESERGVGDGLWRLVASFLFLNSSFFLFMSSSFCSCSTQS